MVSEFASNLLAAIVYALLGIAIFVVAFIVIDRITPGHLWNDLLKDRNTALAILMAGIAIGLSVIIAAAIH